MPKIIEIALFLTKLFQKIKRATFFGTVYMLSYRILLSVTFVYCVETAKHTAIVAMEFE